MQDDKKCCSSVTGYALRLALGGMLLLMGIAKFSGGVDAFVTGSMPMFEGSLIPLALAKAYLTLVPLLEVVLGALMLLGLFTQIAAFVAMFLFALFIVGLTATGKPELMGMLSNNFILLFASAFLGKKSMGMLSLDYLVGGKK